MYKDYEKQKEAVRIHQNNRRKKMYEYKESTPCADCGKYFPHYIMQFDHSKDKSFTIANRSASFGSKLFMEELSKCTLVCSNCHATRTWKRRNGIEVL